MTRPEAARITAQAPADVAPSRAIANGVSETVHRVLEHGKLELRARLVAPLIRSAIVWALVAVFGIIAIIFLYVLAYRYLADRLQDPAAASAIIAGANIALVGILVVARSFRGRRR